MKKTSIFLGFAAILVLSYLVFIGFTVYHYWIEKDKEPYYLKKEITPIQVEKIEKDTVEVNHKYDHLICTEQE